MKTLIVKEEFVTDLFICDETSKENLNDFCNFLTKDFSSYSLICDFDNVEAYIKASGENPIWELMLDKIDNIKYVSDIDDTIKSDDFYSNLGEHNIFLTTFDAMECERLSLERGYIYMCLENIDSCWELFKLSKNGAKLKVTNSDLIPDALRLNNWDKIKRFASPLTGIIIFDKFILKNKSLQKIVDNVCPLLERLLLKKPSKKAVQISIICELDDTETLNSKYEIIMNWLAEKGINNVTLNIFKHDKSLYPKNFEGLHSRFILTNYFHISSTDSFNFFKPNGKINNDSDVVFNFILNNSNFCFYCKDLMDIKTYVKGLVNDPNCPVVKHRELYINSKDNYLYN